MPDAFHDIDKLGFMFGGGLDINLSRHVALRLIRADYVYSNYQYGAAAVTPRTEIRGVRLTGWTQFYVRWRSPSSATDRGLLGTADRSLCRRPVTATASGSNFNPKRTVKYDWNGTGVKVAGSDASTQIDTTGLQPGSYAVAANLNDGSKHGFASCSARFTVKEPHPP